MPKVKNEILHDLGTDEAIRRLKDACNRAHSISDLQETWRGNEVDFSLSIQGVKISGTVTVSEKKLYLDAKIPLIALPFKSWLPNIMRHAIKERDSANSDSPNSSDKPLILYLHIPKAGGTTFGEYIYNQAKSDSETNEGLIKNGVFFWADGFFREDELAYSNELQNLLQRQDLRAIIGHFAFGMHNFIKKPHQYVTMLRHPVKRLVSSYRHLQLENSMSLEDFAKTARYREMDNDQTRRIAGINPAFGEVTETHLEIAKNNLREHFAFVGITERFDESLVLLKQRLNWGKDFASHPKNVTVKNLEPPTDSALNAIEKLNIYDVELHKFANHLMDEMIAAQGSDFSKAVELQKALNKK